MSSPQPAPPPIASDAAAWHWWLPGLLALLALLSDFAPLQRLDLLAFDLIASFAPATPQKPEAVIVAIDEASLRQLGRWPWPRHTHAQLLAALQPAAPSSIAFAILFDQPDTLDSSSDAAFADAMRTSGRVILPVAPALDSVNNNLHTLVPTAQLAAAAAKLGHVDVEIDPDGRLRRIYLRAGIDSQEWSALSLAAHELRQPVTALPGLRANLQTDGERNTWRRDAENLLNLDRTQQIEHVSYADLLRDPELAAKLKDRAVFVGITAAGISADFATAVTPRGSLMPAVEFHARAYEALRTGTLIQPLSRGMTGLISLLIITAGWLTHRRYRKTFWAANLFFLGLPLLLSVSLMLLARIWYPPIGATLALVLGYGMWAAARFRTTWRDLFLSRSRAAVTLDAVADGVVVVDRQGKIEFVNPVGAQFLEREARVLHGMTLERLLQELGISDRTLLDDLARCIALQETIHVANPQRLGAAMVRVMIGPLPGPDGQITGAVLALSDISAVLAASKQLQHQATHDALTDLPNRALLRDLIQHGLASAQRNGTYIGVMFLDLDDFKRINDSFGHQVGDRVLCCVAERLKATCRATDSVGRWGGDEFVIVLPDLPSADAIKQVASKLLAALATPLIIDDLNLHIGGTLGISLGPSDSESPDQLLSMADTAMYRIKRTGGRNYGFASAEMSLQSRQRLTVETALRSGIQQGELVMFYQPQIELVSGDLHGFEALVRWNRPEHGLILPAGFIPVAEESDLILELGNWVLDETARQLREWLDEGLAVKSVAVNVSARQCQSNNLVDMVAAVLKKHAIPSNLLKLEITETAAMTDITHVETLLNQLDDLGVKVALDDFGTGYSSLSHLRRFPISVLKIDQSFVADALQVADDAAIIDAIIALAHKLDLKVIAEGVETEAQQHFLSARDCDVVQGYFHGHPTNAAMARKLMLPANTGNPHVEIQKPDEQGHRLER